MRLHSASRVWQSAAMSFPAPVWQSFSTPQVRDLAWVLGSPPVLNPARSRTASGRPVHWLNVTWCSAMLEASHSWLCELDRAPAPLLSALSDRDSRLGRYFENLLGFWLAWPENPFYRLVHRGLAVCSQRRTLGELDFLVEDLRSGRLQHWEVAVKFYLGTACGGDYHHWLGPALKDRLDLKVQRLLHHQLDLVVTPEGAGLMRYLNLPPPDPVCLLKGRLFYPPDADRRTWAPTGASPDHLAGWWMSADDFLTRYGARPDLQWVRLPREHWLTTLDDRVTIRDPQGAAAFVERLIQSPDNRAVAVVGIAATPGANHTEITRGFITPPGWPKDHP